MWKVFIVGFCVGFIAVGALAVYVIKNQLKKYKNLKTENAQLREKLTSLVSKYHDKEVWNENIQNGNADDDFIATLNGLQNIKKARNENTVTNTAKGGRRKR